MQRVFSHTRAIFPQFQPLGMSFLIFGGRVITVPRFGARQRNDDSHIYHPLNCNDYDLIIVLIRIPLVNRIGRFF